jgi:hypothetical protein
MRRRNWAGMLAVATTCALVGAASGIATSGAATTTKAATAATAKAKAAKAAASGPGRPDHDGRGGFSVHSESAQLNEAGTAFITVTRDEGTVTAVSGSTITLHEGTSTVAYKDVTVTVPAGATIERNDATAALTDIKVGDRISISASSEATSVRASDPTYKPVRGPGHGGHGGPPPGADDPTP